MSPLCFGGSFNPVHLAHMMCSYIAAKQANFADVALIPTHQPVLKGDNYNIVAPEHRLNMLMLAIEGFDSPGVNYRVETLEFNRSTPSYTIDTATELLNRGWPEVNWLIGADQLINLHRWHRYSDLLKTVQFWVMARPGYEIDWNLVDTNARHLKNNILTVPQYDISATDIRLRNQQNESIIGLVSENVRQYILENRLYL